MIIMKINHLGSGGKAKWCKSEVAQRQSAKAKCKVQRQETAQPLIAHTKFSGKCMDMCRMSKHNAAQLSNDISEKQEAQFDFIFTRDSQQTDKRSNLSAWEN